MSDFILPRDIEAMATQSALDISKAWEMLYNLCTVKQYPMNIAELQVKKYTNLGFSEVESIHKTYHVVRVS